MKENGIENWKKYVQDKPIKILLYWILFYWFLYVLKGKIRFQQRLLDGKVLRFCKYLKRKSEESGGRKKEINLRHWFFEYESWNSEVLKC